MTNIRMLAQQNGSLLKPSQNVILANGKVSARVAAKVHIALGLAEGKSLSVLTVERKQASRKARLVNPADTPDDIIVKPQGLESQQAKWRRYQNNWRWVAKHNVSLGSRVCYSQAWKSYEKFCKSVGIDDLFLFKPSSVFLAESDTPGDSPPFEYKVLVMLSYIAAMYGDEKLSHKTVGTYLSGIRHYFGQKFRSVEFFDEPIISQTRSSLAYLHAQNDSLASEKKTLPFTCDMIVYGKDVFFKGFASTWLRRGIIVGMIIAFCCLLRRSELLITEANHFLRGQDVVFDVMHNGKQISIYPRAAYLYLRTTVVGVSITVHSAKNDWEGEGHRMYFTRHDETAAYGFDLVMEMFDWAQEAKPRNDDAFLTHGGTHIVDYESMTKAIKDIAVAFKFDPARYSMHSLRVGGASTLAASGKPTHYIQKMGRWKSLAFLGYIFWAVSGMADALRTLSNPVYFTASDVAKVHPGVMLRR